MAGYRRFRAVSKGPRSAGGVTPILPVLWTIARNAAAVDEGTAAVYTTTVNRQGNAAVALEVSFRVPSAVDGISITATNADFDASFIEAITTAVAATTGATLTVLPNSVARVAFSAAWNGTFAVTRTSVNNPAEQGDLLDGMEIFGQSAGTLSVASISITITDLTDTPVIPTNSVAPALSSAAPAVGSQVTAGTGGWANTPTSYLYQWQSLIDTVPPSFADAFDRANSNLSANANWSVVSGNANFVTVLNNAVATTSTSGTFVAAPDLDDVDHYVQATVKTVTVGAGRLFLKFATNQNVIYLRTGSATFEVIVRVSNVSNIRMTPAKTGFAANDTLTLQCVNNVLTFKRNGVVVGSTYSLTAGEITALGAATRAGIGTDSAGAGVVCYDDFLHGGYTGGTGVPSDIASATAATYTPVSGDLDAQLRCGVIARNAAGDGAITYSAYTSPVASTPVVTPVPANAGGGDLPAISDTTPNIGQVLTCSTGTWTNNPNAFAYQWQLAGVNISGETNSTYTVVSGDSGSTLRCGVVAGNAAGNGTQTFSAATSAVAAAPGGALTDVTLSSDFVLVGAAADTVVGTFVGVGGAISTVTFLSNGDAGARFKKTGTTPTFQLKVAAVSPDFEGPVIRTGAGPASQQVTNGIPWYTVSLRFVGVTSGAFDKTFIIRAQQPAINPTGDETANITDVSTYANLRTNIGTGAAGTNNKTVRVNSSFTGTLAAVTSTTVLNSNNFTILGHRRAIAFKDTQLFVYGGDNLVVRGVQFRAGGASLYNSSGVDTLGYKSGIRDSVSIGHNSGAVSQYKITNIIFENCDFSWAPDEAFHIYYNTLLEGPYPRNVRFHRCLIHDGLVHGGAVGGNQAPYGPMIYPYAMNVVFDKCVIIGHYNRSPLFNGKCQGTLVQNCIIAYRSGSGASNYGGSGYQSTKGVQESNMLGTHILRGTLYYPQPVSTDGLQVRGEKSRAIHFSYIGPNCYIYIPVSPAPYVNHFFTPISADLDNVPLANFPSDQVGSNGWYFYPGKPQESVTSVVIDYAPFEPADYDVMPTSTAAERKALFDDVMYKVGVRTYDTGQLYGTTIDSGRMAMSKIGYDAVTRLLTDGGNFRARGSYPTGLTYSSGGPTYGAVASNINTTYDVSVTHDTRP